MSERVPGLVFRDQSFLGDDLTPDVRRVHQGILDDIRLNFQTWTGQVCHGEIPGTMQTDPILFFRGAGSGESYTAELLWRDGKFASPTMEKEGPVLTIKDGKPTDLYVVFRFLPSFLYCLEYRVKFDENMQTKCASLRINGVDYFEGERTKESEGDDLIRCASSLLESAGKSSMLGGLGIHIPAKEVIISFDEFGKPNVVRVIRSTVSALQPEEEENPINSISEGMEEKLIVLFNNMGLNHRPKRIADLPKISIIKTLSEWADGGPKMVFEG